MLVSSEASPFYSTSMSTSTSTMFMFTSSILYPTVPLAVLLSW